jgi:hypothetical protein
MAESVLMIRQIEPSFPDQRSAGRCLADLFLDYRITLLREDRYISSSSKKVWAMTSTFGLSYFVRLMSSSPAIPGRPM